MKKNLFLTFCFSFVPGAGQMYQGYMKRGISIMILFGFVVALTSISSTPILAIPLPIIFAYSFFDTYNIRNNILNEKTPKDEYIWNDFKDDNVLKDFRNKKINNIFGILLVFIGIYILLNSVILNLANRFELYFISNLMGVVLRYLPSAVIAFASIYFGIKLVSKKQ